MNARIENLVIPGYQIIEQLYVGAKTIVYRAIRSQDNYRVVIKILASEYPTFNELLHFRNQYTVAKNLTFPGIISPLMLETYHNGYMLVMEDFGGISLRKYSKNIRVLEITEFLNIAIQLTDILHSLYHNRVIHKDIKPANILIHPDSKQVKLIDFSISSLIPRETQEIKNPNVLEGTLAYISPEQTGRMNRGIDYRSDFYSLGVTFFELLTGELPFVSDDPMELIHFHIAKQAVLVSDIKSEIPIVISNIICKLMAKNAEDRYQSALGLKYDLEACLYQLKDTGKIEYFEIGKRDICDNFIIPEKLYGRELEVTTLLDSFERVANGSSELMLVAGFSGIGKTAVVNEVHKPIVRQRGYFIKGKYDQFNRNIPFSAFVQAFRDLMGQLLTENDKKIHEFKSKIIEALGDNGQVIIEVIPELERIIGKQPPVSELSGTAAQNRFNLLFQKFLKIFTTKEHPLVIFLDDLQWSDLASLKVMQLLMSESNSGYLLVIGAYRDNEVSPAHSLMLTVDDIKKKGAIVNSIILESLNEHSLNNLVADTLNCALEFAQPLTQLVYQKTKGNPFFSTQFIKALHEDGLIKFDLDAGYWQCDIVGVKELALCDDVLEFMALQLQKLPAVTQDILKLAACIGNEFDLSTLAIVSKKSETETATNLWKALQEGLILPKNDIYKFYIGREANDVTEGSQVIIYKFLHDRVQQAAYSLIPEDQKQKTHLQIGQLLLKNTTPEEQESKIFDIVNQLNHGWELITEHSEFSKLAKLNLIAGHKAKTNTAYTSAVEYLTIGINLLAAHGWENHYDLSLSLYEEAAEVSCLNGDFAQANNWVNIIFQQAKTIIDKVKAYEVLIQIKIAQNQLIEALKIGLQVLDMFDVTLAESPNVLDIQQAMEETKSYLPDKNISDLINLPLMTDAYQLAAMRMLSVLCFPTIAAAPRLFSLTVFSQVNLSIKYGNSPLSSFSYANYGLILQSFQDTEGSYEFGKLAFNLVEKLNVSELKAKTYFMVAVSTKHGKEHIKSTLPLFQEAYQSGIENGDLEYASHAAMNLFQYSYFANRELTELKQEITAIGDALITFKQTAILNHYATFQQVILNLTSQCEQPYRLVGEVYNEEKILPLQLAANDRIGLHFFYLHKLILCYLFGSYSQAMINAEQARIYLDALAGCIYAPILYFYDSLALLTLYSEFSDTQKHSLLQKVTTNQDKIQHLAHHAPMNYLHKFYLVEAQRYGVLGNKTEAMEYYDKAISGAKENGYIQEEALGNELAGKFYLNWGKEKVAAGYMQEAYYCYARWGAKAKTDDLEKRYPQLLKPILQQQKLTLNSLETIATQSHSPRTQNTITTNSTSISISDALDFTSILKASQNLSSEIELDKLIENLMQILLQNTGATKGALILPKGGNWVIASIVNLHSHQNQQHLTCSIMSLDSTEELPKKIIYGVKNTLESIIIDDISQTTPWAGDEYLIQQQPKSVLCTPILNQGKLQGILYLENQQTAEVFANSRIQTIHILCTQAAISIENANLYSTLEQKVIERTQELSHALENLKATQKKLIEAEKMAALGSLVAGLAHEINTPIGTSITAASMMIAKTQTFAGAIAQGAIKRSLLQEYADTAQESSNLILTNLQRAGDLVQSFKQIAVDQSYLEQRRFLVTEYIEEILLSLSPKLKQTPHNVTVTGDKTISITSYPGAFAQIITNLVMNSLIHAYPGDTAGNCCFEVSKQGEIVTIRYHDDGCGIPIDNLSKIFDPFFTTKRNQGGTGLGLHIVYNLVTQKLQGSVDVNSQVGVGTEFIISIPLDIDRIYVRAYT